MYNIQEMAQKLNVSDKTIRRQIKKLGITESKLDNKNRKLYSEEAFLKISEQLGNSLESSLDKSRQGLDQGQTPPRHGLDNSEKPINKGSSDSLDNVQAEPTTAEVIKVLEKQLDFYKAQIEIKDKEISTLHGQLDNVHTLLSQEQQLALLSQKQIEDLKKQLLLAQPKEETANNDTVSTVSEENTVKKSWFSRFFGF